MLNSHFCYSRQTPSLAFPEASTSTNPFCQAPTQFSDRYGNTVQLQRAPNNGDPTSCQLLKIVSPNGRFISLAHDTQGRITQAQDNSGRTVSYTYDAAGRLSTVTDAGGGVTTYTYNDQNQMVSIQDARGIVYSISTNWTSLRHRTRIIRNLSSRSPKGCHIRSLLVL